MDLALLLAALLGGAALTFVLPLAFPPLARLAAGFCLGTVTMGLAGLVLGHWMQLQPAALAAAAALTLLPLALVAARPVLRARVADAASTLRASGAAARAQPAKALAALAAALVLTVLLARVFSLGCFVDANGLQTADAHNLGDLPFHLAVIQGFVRGHNFPPQHPELAGSRLTYPFLVDLAAAQLVAAGATPERALFEHDLALALALAVLLAFFARRITGDRLAALITPFLVFLSGGLGFLLLATDLDPMQGGLWGLLGRLSSDYTMRNEAALRFGNALTTLLVTQRSLLLGLPLFLAAAAAWWDGVSAPAGEGRPPLRAAGILVGLLPLVHGHSFAAALAVGTALALLFLRAEWASFVRAALLLALPQVVWMGSGSSMRLGRFLEWQVGWDHGALHPILFWIWNAGVFIPLLVAALLWVRGGRLVSPKLLRFYLPFACCFVLPNLLRMSPWIWDNIKFLFLWWAASAPLVALLLARLLRGSTGARVAGLALLGAATLAGALDVWRMAQPARTYVIFPPFALEAAESVAALLPPQALVLHAPTFDSPLPLSGRRSVLGYEGHIWSQGLEQGRRAERLRQIYSGDPEAADLVRTIGVDAILLGPQERAAYKVDEAFLSRWPVIADVPPYRLYRTR